MKVAGPDDLGIAGHAVEGCRFDVALAPSLLRGLSRSNAGGGGMTWNCSGRSVASIGARGEFGSYEYQVEEVIMLPL